MAAAFDFSNRDPKDPRGVATVTPYAVPDAWLPAGEGDWSTYATDPSDAAKRGLTRKVSLAQVTLNNGEQYFAVQDANGKPIDLIGDRTGVDDKQHSAFTQQQNASTPNSGSPTQTRKGADGLDHIYQWNPQTRQYDTDLGALAGTGPPGGKPYIDDGAEAGQSGRRWGWNQQTHAYDRDLGPSPAAQLPTKTTEREPVKERPGYSVIKTTDPVTKQIETHYEKDDAPGVAVQLPSDTKNENVTYRKNAAGQIEKVTTTTVNGAKSETVTPVLPSERTSVGTKTSTVNGKTVKTTTWQLPDGSKIDTTDEAVDAANAPIPKGAPQYVPDYNAPDLGLTAYNEQVLQWVQSGAEGATRDVGRQLLETAVGLATQTASHGTTLTSQASTTRGQDITQRGQTLGEVQSRRSAADTGFDNAQTTYIGNAAHLGRGNGGLAADAFREALTLRQANAQQAGGYANVPEVPMSPAVAAVRTTTVHPDGKVVHSTPVFAPPPAASNMQPAPSGAGISGSGPTSAQSVAAPAVSTGSAAPASDLRNSSDMDLPPGTPTAAPTAPAPDTRVIDTLPDAARFSPDAGTAPPYNPDPSQGPVGQVPAYLQPARSAAPTWDPSPVVAELKRRGFSDAAINQALQEHQQEMGVAA